MKYRIDGSNASHGRCHGVTNGSPNSARRTQGGIALLLALFTLLCAICPLGLPASQKLGPAFNPANEVVTVRPEARLPSVRGATETPDPRGPAPIVAAWAQPVRIAALPARRFDAGAADPLPTPPPAAFLARGPPARA